MSEADFLVLQRQFAQQIRHPLDASLPMFDRRRMGVYQDLFYNNLEGFLAGCYPVLKEILVAHHHWEIITRDFMARHTCATPYFLQICEEFLQYLARDDIPLSLPEYAQSLAHWEWMELFADINDVEDSAATFNTPLLDGVARITNQAWLCQYAYPVHEISLLNSEPLPRDTYLLVYRHADKVGFLGLNPLSAMLFQTLQQNPQQQSCREILLHIASQSGLAVDTVLAGGLPILEQWKRMGVLIGTH
jgi:uncharacterized protein